MKKKKTALHFVISQVNGRLSKTVKRSNLKEKQTNREASKISFIDLGKKKRKAK